MKLAKFHKYGPGLRVYIPKEIAEKLPLILDGDNATVEITGGGSFEVRKVDVQLREVE